MILFQEQQNLVSFCGQRWNCIWELGKKSLFYKVCKEWLLFLCAWKALLAGLVLWVASNLGERTILRISMMRTSPWVMFYTKDRKVTQIFKCRLPGCCATTFLLSCSQLGNHREDENVGDACGAQGSMDQWQGLRSPWSFQLIHPRC